MNLNHRDFRPRLVRIFVERNEARFPGLDEVDQTRNASYLGLEPTWVQSILAMSMNGPAIFPASS